MAKYHLEILSPAWQDLNNIADYHLQMAGIISAKKVTDCIMDTLDKLQRFPLIGALHSDTVLAKMQYRKIRCGDYVCVYRLIEKTVFVYRIVHGATDYPKYFR